MLILHHGTGADPGLCGRFRATERANAVLCDGRSSRQGVDDAATDQGHGVKVWMITDTCNSGTNYRSPTTMCAGSPTDRARRSAASHGADARTARARSVRRRRYVSTALVDAYKHGQSYADGSARSSGACPYAASGRGLHGRGFSSPFPPSSEVDPVKRAASFRPCVH
jgi:hypothetical protein